MRPSVAFSGQDPCSCSPDKLLRILEKALREAATGVSESIPLTLTRQPGKSLVIKTPSMELDEHVRGVQGGSKFGTSFLSLQNVV